MNTQNKTIFQWDNRKRCLSNFYILKIAIKLVYDEII